MSDSVLSIREKRLAALAKGREHIRAGIRTSVQGYAARKAAGLCVGCGLRPPVTTRCEECRVKHAGYRRRAYRVPGTVVHDVRGEQLRAAGILRWETQREILAAEQADEKLWCDCGNAKEAKAVECPTCTVLTRAARKF
jgi:hypothetical protein